MCPPNLTNSIDAIAVIPVLSLEAYLSLLRDTVSPTVRKLEADREIQWFSFLVHDRESAGRNDLPSTITGPFLHARFSVSEGSDIPRFIDALPPPFIHPIERPLGPVGGIDVSILGGDWAKAWWMIGEASDWVLKLAEAHSSSEVPVQQMTQFLHFITNGLLIGGRSICIPAGFHQF